MAHSALVPSILCGWTVSRRLSVGMWGVEMERRGRIEKGWVRGACPPKQMSPADKQEGGATALSCGRHGGSPPLRLPCEIQSGPGGLCESRAPQTEWFPSPGEVSKIYFWFISLEVNV